VILHQCTLLNASLYFYQTATDSLLDLRLNLANFACCLRRSLSRDEVCRCGTMPKIHESTGSLRCRPNCCLQHLCRNTWLQMRAHNNQCGVEFEIFGRGNAGQRSAEQQLGVEELRASCDDTWVFTFIVVVILHPCTLLNASLYFYPTATDSLVDLRLNLTNFARCLRRSLLRDEVCRWGTMPKIH